MSVNSLSLVNQKLAYARALLALVQGQGTNEKAADALQRKALLDATVSHLVCGYQHYLRELAEGLRVKSSGSVKAERDLVGALTEIGKTSSEADELLALRIKDDSWLANLYRSYEQQWAMTAKPSASRAATDENLIGAVAIDQSLETTEASVTNVMLWYNALVDVIQRQRETCAEY